MIVSEPFANKHGVRAGDTLTLPLGGQRARFRVVDVYYDYSNERGYIIMDRGTLLQVSARSGAFERRRLPEARRRTRRWRAAPSRRRSPGAECWSSPTARCARRRSAVFDRTFAITYALEAVAVFVAVMGVAGALLALVIDRRREFGLLRFLGGATRQIRRIILFEAGLLGLLANIAGMVLGYRAVAAADLRHQQAVVRLDHSVPLAGRGAAVAPVASCTPPRFWPRSTRRASPRG